MENVPLVLRPQQDVPRTPRKKQQKQKQKQKQPEKQLPVEVPLKNTLSVLRKLLGSSWELSRNFHLGRTRLLTLTERRAEWPPFVRNGLGMQLEDGKFYITHAKEYQQVQERFYSVVNSLNPDFLVGLVNLYPYHLDSLLALSQVHKHQNDIQTAAELVERCVYTFEKAFHARFTFNSLLDYRRVESRTCFFIIFRHIEYLARKSCWRTCLEYSKWLLSMDLDDPLCCFAQIDYLALKAGEYAWYLEFYFQFNDRLQTYPNAVYARAMAQFEIELNDKRDHEESTRLLMDALQAYPRVASLIFEKLALTFACPAWK